ncbi:hypothetical protein [Yinghuangia seranimata]|uniref:hypothetical protein n=1 Tax=Yinghuangia seranimata TaxID=408067 RepID=UPI00248BB833|nr:hypothetical protein [Yinghuangia seranimata]MDI2128740.1 hypothetical protein [Yinghuangia seranimata]
MGTVQRPEQGENEVAEYDEVEEAAEHSRASHGVESGFSTRALVVSLVAILLLVTLAGLAMWAGASFSGGSPGTTAPAK